MPVSDPALWTLIADWPLPFRNDHDPKASPPRVCQRFEHNLRAAGDWSDAASDRITEGYRRFLYLKALSDEPLTPPHWVDEAWHLHLGFRDDYAALERAVGRPLPHRRTILKKEANRAYTRGRALWRREFDADPPPDLWPALGLVAAGNAISTIGVGLWIIGFVAPFTPWSVSPWLFGLGIVLVLAGNFLTGKYGPQVVSRCA